jgi:hypothetical protein
MKAQIVIAAIILVSGCTKIHFDQSEPVVPDPGDSQSKWHHNMALSLVEVSPAVDLEAKCGANRWESVKTEKSFLNGLVTAIPYVSWIWTPKTVTVQCKEREA